MGVCNTGGVAPQVSQALVCRVTRRQLRGPGIIEWEFGLAFTLRIEVPSFG
jgi:hypothetical protein